MYMDKFLIVEMEGIFNKKINLRFNLTYWTNLSIFWVEKVKYNLTPSIGTPMVVLPTSSSFQKFWGHSNTIFEVYININNIMSQNSYQFTQKPVQLG